MSSQTEKVEQFLKASHDVIAPDHAIAIRYHRFQDDHRDEPLEPGAHCYIVLNDKRHLPYLISAIIRKVDKKTEKYEIQRINDNQIETYHYHQIVVPYDKNIHSIDIQQHKQSIESQRNHNTNKIKKIKKKESQKQNKRKRKRDDNESIDNNTNVNANNTNTNENDNRPNKKRKLNDMNASNMNTKKNNNDSIINNINKAYDNVLTIAQPYFPIPHPYFRQNALLKWRNNEEWDVGRIVDFDIDNDIIYIQNTYRCGTKDDETTDLIETNWNQFKQKTDAQFIDDFYLYQLKQPVLYWWDRPGCGCVCEDKIQSLDYGSTDNLLYGITGGDKSKKKWKDHLLKWVHKDGLFEPTEKIKSVMSKYISRTHGGAYKKPKPNITANKKYDVIVIGGGMAGLTTAWALDKINKGYKIKVLEAQNYIGGRLKTHIFPQKIVCDPNNKNIYKLPKVSVEEGAAFLSGSGKDNRFWEWLKKNQKHICADWGGYNNGWWNGQSFIDSELGEFVSDMIIERIKNICDDIQILCCKLLMPLDDMSVIDGLEYLKHKIPQEQLFVFDKDDELIRDKIQKYFYNVYDKYKILSANWVGPQGLWQQQQTVELQNLDFEALYKFLLKIFGGNNKKSKKWLNATENLIMDYYGDKTNIKTQNFDVWAEKRQYDEDSNSYCYETDDKIITINGNTSNTDDDLYNPHIEEDSEATESENDHSVTLSPLLVPTKRKHNNMNAINLVNNIDDGEFKLSQDYNWDEIVRYDVSDYNGVEYQYKFGFRDILVRDIIHPPHEEEAAEFEKTTGLVSVDYQRFRDALQHLADCNLFSYHLHWLRSDEKWRNNSKVKRLCVRFKEDLASFDSAIQDFKKVLSGKRSDEVNYTKPHIYHTNRKTRDLNNRLNVNINRREDNNTANMMKMILSDLISGVEKNIKMEGNVMIIVKDEQNAMDIEDIDKSNNILTSNILTPPNEICLMKDLDKDMIVKSEEVNKIIMVSENESVNNEAWVPSLRKKRRHKKHKKKDKKKSNKKKSKKKKHIYSIESDYERIDMEADIEFTQDKFNNKLSLNPSAQIIGDGFIPGGYSQVLEPFLEQLDNKNIININHQVTSVEKIPGGKFGELLNEVRGIDLVTGKPFTFWSPFVAVSVPLGILKLSLNELTKSDCNNCSGIKFKPALSMEKHEAINAMGMGCENKVYLRFTKCFWPRDKPYFQSIQHPEYRFINLSYKQFKLPANTNVLCSMIPPTMGKKWYSNNPAQELRVIWDVLRVLNQMFKVRDNIVQVDTKIEMNGGTVLADVVMNDNKMKGVNVNVNVNNGKMEENVPVNDIIKEKVVMNGHVCDIVMREDKNDKLDELKQEMQVNEDKNGYVNGINMNDVVMKDSNKKQEDNGNELKIEEIEEKKENENENKMEDIVMNILNSESKKKEEKEEIKQIMHQYNNDKMEEDSDENILYDSYNRQRVCKLLNNTEEISELLEMLVDYKVTDWEHNVFTRGSYSYLPKGAIYTHCKSLQRYDGNGIYFCGEATSIEGFECVDGAHETGFNVAKEIHKHLQKFKLKHNKH